MEQFKVKLEQELLKLVPRGEKVRSDLIALYSEVIVALKTAKGYLPTKEEIIAELTEVLLKKINIKLPKALQWVLKPIFKQIVGAIINWIIGSEWYKKAEDVLK